MEKLKDIMKTKGICLLEFGVNSRAFNREEIQDILEILREEGIAIKGGDVWKKNDNNIILMIIGIVKETKMKLTLILLIEV